MLKQGAILTHRLGGMPVLLLKVVENERGKGVKAQKFKMLKCRYFAEGQFHIHEFYPIEIREIYLNPDLMEGV